MSQESSAMSQTASAPTAPYPRRSASYLFWLLWFANFINYVDRFAISAVLGPIGQEFQLNDSQEGLLATSFLFVYTLTIFPTGLIADRIKRKFVVTAGIAFWSIVTAFTALASGFTSLFITRAALGAGEGTYFPASTSMLAGSYPEEKRAEVMSRWNTGLLAGAAVGVLAGGYLFDLFGGQWRPIFYVFGLPGLLLALLIFLVREPPRQATGETHTFESNLAQGGLRGILADTRELMRTRTLRIVVALQALSFFVFGATALFLNRLIAEQFGLKLSTASTITGGVLIVGGITGLLTGGILADRLIKRFPGARVLVSGWGLLLSAPTFIISVLAMITDFGLPLNVRLYGIFVPAFFLTVALLQVNSGPLTAVSQDVVTPGRRAAAVGITLMLSHLLGDLFSPTIVGVISDTLRNNFAGQFFITQHNTLGIAFLLTCVPVLLIAGYVGLTSAHVVKPDLEKVKGTAGVPPVAALAE